MPARVKPIEILADKLVAKATELKKAAITRVKLSEDDKEGTPYSQYFPDFYKEERKAFFEFIELIARSCVRQAWNDIIQRQKITPVLRSHALSTLRS